MAETGKGRVFISYSTKDGAEFAENLRQDLEERDFSIWQDLVALKGGRDWWSQIEDTLRAPELQHFILVVTPCALESRVVRQEIRLARQEGKTVCPIKGPGMPDPADLPRWLGQIYDLKQPEHKKTLIRVLEDQSREKRMPMMAPEPPPDFVERPVEFDALKEQLLDVMGDSVAITAALKGAGGYGKTTLAMKLAHDPDIQDAYFDGVLWAELGESPDNLLGTISDLITRLTGNAPGLETINAAAAALAEAMGDRRILLVVDDVWRAQDLKPFLQGGANTTRLITTRIDHVLPADTHRKDVDAMREGEALALLSSALPEAETANLTNELLALTDRLGEWAQLVKIVNGFLRDRVVKAGQPLADAITGVNKRLDAKGLTAFDPRKETDRTKAVALTIGVSLELLDADQRDRFSELGVFPEDVDVPLGIVARLWGETGDLDEFETEDLLSQLYGLSLLLRLDLEKRTIRFHDTVRQYLRDETGAAGLSGQNACLLRAMNGLAEDGVADDVERLYYYQFLPDHMAAAGAREDLDRLLLDPEWLKDKLDATNSPISLVGDYERHGSTEAHSLIGRSLRLVVGICTRDPRQLIPQLHGRLMAMPAAVKSGFCDALNQTCVDGPSIITTRPSLTPPGVESARLDGQEGMVMSLAVLPDGRLASGFSSGTVRVWDVETGAESAHFEGHEGGVFSIAVLPDRCFASGGNDKTIRVWDIATGAEISCLEGHDDRVRSLAVLPNGYLASGSSDNTVLVWDITTGAEFGRLKGHEDRVRSIIVLPDGSLASGGDDNAIRIWDVANGAEIRRFEGHDGWVWSLAVLPDGRLASGGGDSTIRIWDVATGAECTCLNGHEAGVFCLAVLPDGRLASGGFDDTIRIWDVANGAETGRFEGHDIWVWSLAVLPDGRLASGGGDNTIRIWDVATGVESTCLDGHEAGVWSLALLPDGNLASGSGDNTVRIWDVATGAESTCLDGHKAGVWSLALLPDGRLASGAGDNVILIWDVAMDSECACLEGHEDWVRSLAVLPDGNLASGSNDSTIRIWGVATGAESVCLRGHSDWVWSLAVLPDGRLASGSPDKTIRIWDVAMGVENARLESNVGEVRSLAALPDGRLAFGGEGKTICIWDIAMGAESACLEGHEGEISSLAVLPKGRLASAAFDNTVRIWDLATKVELARLELDRTVSCLIVGRDGGMIAGDRLGRLHWLKIID